MSSIRDERVGEVDEKLSGSGLVPFKGEVRKGADGDVELGVLHELEGMLPKGN